MRNYWLPPKKITVQFITETLVTVRTGILDYWKKFDVGETIEVNKIIANGTNMLTFKTEIGDITDIPTGTFIVF